MPEDSVLIRAVGSEDATLAAEILVRAFEPDPHMRWLFEAGRPGYLDRVRGYARIGDAWHRGIGGDVEGVYDASGLVAVLYGMSPDLEMAPDDYPALLEEMRGPCGAREVERFAAYNAEMDVYAPEEDHHAIALLAVVPEQQGRGHGGRLVEAWCRRCDTHERSVGVHLDTGNPRNLPFYARYGFREVGAHDYGDFVERALFRPRAERGA